MHLTRSQWAVIIALTLLVITPFVSAALLHHRIEHPESGSHGLHNLNQPVRTLVVAPDWEINLFLGSESKQRNGAPNQPFREGAFLNEITDRSVEIYCPTGTEGLFERNVEQRGDTLFFREPDTFYPLQARLNLPPRDSLTIISRGEVKVFTFPEADAPLPVAHVQVCLSGTAFLRWYGIEVREMTVEASDYARLNYIVRPGGEPSWAEALSVTAADRSWVKVHGFYPKPNQVHFTLTDEAAFVYDNKYTATRLGTLAHE